jgi:hypothetical protein
VFGLPRRRSQFRWYNGFSTVLALAVALALVVIVCLWAINYDYPS